MSKARHAARSEEQRVELGRISGVFGVKGWVKVYSETKPRENIVNYSPWQVCVRGEWQEMKVLSGKRQGKTVVASLEGIEDRDAAAMLRDAPIAIWRSQLPPPKQGEVYWADLEGLAVRTTDGVELGTISHMVETGSNDVMVVHEAVDGGKRKERLVPFIREQVVKEVDIEGGLVTVDWDPEF